MLLSQELAEKIASLKPVAEGKKGKEAGNVASADQRMSTLEAARAKDASDASAAEKALVTLGYIEGLRPVYEAMTEDNPHAAGLLAIIQALTVDAEMLAAASDDPIPV